MGGAVCTRNRGLLVNSVQLRNVCSPRQGLRPDFGCAKFQAVLMRMWAFDAQGFLGRHNGRTPTDNLLSDVDPSHVSFWGE